MPAHYVLRRSELIGAARTPQGDDLVAAVEQPAYGEGQHGLAVAVARERRELVDGLEILPEPRLLEFGVDLAQIVALERRLRRDLAGEETAAERAIGEHDEAVLLGVRQDIGLDLALEQIVGRLNGGERRLLAEAVHLRRREIADADRPDLALAAEVLQRRRRLLEGHALVGPVHLINVDHVGLQPAERILELLAEPRRDRCARSCRFQSSPTLVAISAWSRRPP